MLSCRRVPAWMGLLALVVSFCWGAPALAGRCVLKEPAPGVDPLEGLYGDPLADIPPFALDPRNPERADGAADLKAIRALMNPRFIAFRIETYGRPSFAISYRLWITGSETDFLSLEAQPGLNALRVSANGSPRRTVSARAKILKDGIEVFVDRASLPGWAAQGNELGIGDLYSFPSLHGDQALYHKQEYWPIQFCETAP